MQYPDRTKKQGDKLLKMPGKLDRGPVEFKSKPVEHEGEILAIASRNVITITPTMSILGAVETMTGWGFRRLPIIDAGSRTIRGIITSGDIINFLGGGDKFNLVQVRHGGNLLAAVNEPVRTIMTSSLVTLDQQADIKDAIVIITGKKTGGIPITDNHGVLLGIVTERDVLRVLANQKSAQTVEEAMSTSLRITLPDSPIGEVTRQMTRYRFRRLPVVSDDVLFGIITTTDIMKYLGTGRAFSILTTGDVAELTSRPVRELITGNLFTITPEKSVTDAAREMLSRNVGALPVIENTHLIGLVTEFDLVKALSKE